MVLGSQQPQLSVTSRNVYSSSSTLLFTYLRNKSTRYAGNKKTPEFQGSHHCFIPSSCGLHRRNWHPSCYVASGLPGFIGPFPSTSRDENRSYCIYSIVWYFRVISKYTEGVLTLSRGADSEILNPRVMSFGKCVIL